MTRISRDQMWMMMCEAASRRSTCKRLNVGAIIVHANDVVSVGYNGPPSGEEHCTGAACGIPSCTRAVHAEDNALRRAGAKGFVCDDTTTLYVTNSPCEACTIKIIESGIKRVVYRDEYRIAGHLVGFKAAGVRLFRITPSGYMIDYETGQFVDQ